MKPSFIGMMRRPTSKPGEVAVEHAEDGDLWAKGDFLSPVSVWVLSLGAHGKDNAT